MLLLQHSRSLSRIGRVLHYAFYSFLDGEYQIQQIMPFSFSVSKISTAVPMCFVGTSG